METFEKCHFEEREPAPDVISEERKPAPDVISEERKRLRNPKIPHYIRDMDFSLRSKWQKAKGSKSEGFKESRIQGVKESEKRRVQGFKESRGKRNS